MSDVDTGTAGSTQLATCEEINDEGSSPSITATYGILAAPASVPADATVAVAPATISSSGDAAGAAAAASGSISAALQNGEKSIPPGFRKVYMEVGNPSPGSGKRTLVPAIIPESVVLMPDLGVRYEAFPEGSVPKAAVPAPTAAVLTAPQGSGVAHINEKLEQRPTKVRAVCVVRG